MFNIVLVEPEIAGNVGNIARLCAVTGCAMHLVHPLGFQIDDKKLKRAGLDYWHMLSIYYYDSFAEVRTKYKENNFYFLTTKAKKIYSDVKFLQNDFFVFGKETAGLPETILRNNWDDCVTLPMVEEARSLNLSNAVAVVIYEAIRQGNNE